MNDTNKHQTNEHQTIVWQIISHLFHISKDKGNKTLDHVKKNAPIIRRKLLQVVLCMIVIPLIPFILGIILDKSWMIGLAGLLLVIETALVAISTRPIVSMLQVILQKTGIAMGDKVAKEIAGRWVNVVTSILIFECLSAMYFMLVPGIQQPMLFFLMALSMVIIAVISLSMITFMSYVLRAIGIVVAVIMFYIVTMTALVPLDKESTNNEMTVGFKALEQISPLAIYARYFGKDGSPATAIIDKQQESQWLNGADQQATVKLQTSGATHVVAPIKYTAGDTVRIRVTGELLFDRWARSGDAEYLVEILSCGPEGTWPHLPEPMPMEAYQKSICPVGDVVFNAIAWVIDLDDSDNTDWLPTEQQPTVTPIGNGEGYMFIWKSSGTLILGINRPEAIAWDEQITPYLRYYNPKWYQRYPPQKCDALGRGHYNFEVGIWRAKTQSNLNTETEHNLENQPNPLETSQLDAEKLQADLWKIVVERNKLQNDPNAVTKLKETPDDRVDSLKTSQLDINTDINKLLTILWKTTVARNRLKSELAAITTLTEDKGNDVQSTPKFLPRINSNDTSDNWFENWITTLDTSQLDADKLRADIWKVLLEQKKLKNDLDAVTKLREDPDYNLEAAIRFIVDKSSNNDVDDDSE